MDTSFEEKSKEEMMNLLSSSSSTLKVSNPDDGSTKELEEDVPMTFPQRLMEILSDEAHSDVIGWLPHGKGFIIYKKKKFAAEILPLYFKQSKFTSFTRKLNRWGFTRVTRGPETGAYYHKFFRKGDLRLCMQMSCQSSKVMPQQQQQQQAQPFSAGFGANNMFAGGNPADIAQQNQSLIRHQLQQLQMQQLHLQQLQMQQQQQLQAAEFMRQALSKQNGGQQGAGEELSLNNNNSNNGGKYDPNSLFLQTLQRTKDSGSGLMGSGPIALLPANTASLGEPTRPAAGNGRAWAA